MSAIVKISKNVLYLPRYLKRSIVITMDIILCVLCVWLAFYLRLEEFVRFNNINILPVIISVILAIPIFWIIGLYKTMFRFAGSSILFSVAIGSFFYGLIYFTIIGIYGFQGIPRSIGIINPLLLFLVISGSRLTIKYFFLNNFSLKRPKNKKKILIYGAGSAGRQLLASLENNPEMKVVGFLDDNEQFHDQTILGQTVFNPQEIEQLSKLKNIDLVLLALPSISSLKRNQIINNLNTFKIKVKTLPSIQDIVDGKISVADIKDLSIEDLLGREQVKPDLQLMSKNITSKIVLVTGAGGSIGSELCRQIVRLKPKILLLIELNEFALYKIDEELKKQTSNINIIPLIANVQNLSRLEAIFKNFHVDTVYHAAAYKHVPLVEANICEGVKNNVFGTFLLAKTSIIHEVSNFVLVSSDKAVRPTNIMGASKRLAEICVQSLYNEFKFKKTKFAIVRFGNVLQSSGSVIPKFKKQIEEGGPVTLTHPEVTRFFMTLTESSQLVIQAGAMTEACEVFILDMGKSVKIKSLVYKMIKLSGLTIKENINPEGDIEIKTIGLRPGEKLYEELLLGDNPKKTFHEKIQKAQDPFIPLNLLQKELDKMSFFLENNKIYKVKNLLKNLLPTYKSNSEIVDYLYENKQINENHKTNNLNKNKNNIISIK